MALSKIFTASGIFIRNSFSKIPAVAVQQQQRQISHRIHGDDITCRYECFFNREDLDGWDIRQGMNDLLGYDAVPEPPVIIAALHACRRVNDYAMSVRFLEAVKNRCGGQVNVIYPYIVQEIAPTLCELGCDLPEGLCYHKPELFCHRYAAE